MEGQTLALVTGATSGIGMAIAQRWAARGGALALTGRNAAALKECARRWREIYGVPVWTCAADLTQPEAIEHLWSGTLAFADTNRLHFNVVVNNAGFGAFGEDARIDEATLTGMLQLNVFALTLLTHRAALSFGRKEGGQILNVASTAAFQACPYLAAYAATKSYVLSYSRALDEELRGSGVRVKCLCPGPTRTHFARAAGLGETSRFDKFAADVDKVADTALALLDGTRSESVHGWSNRLGVFLTRCVSGRLAARIAGRVMQSMN